jgi:hypothetical protein
MECLRGEGELSHISRVLTGNVTRGFRKCLRAREREGLMDLQCAAIRSAVVRRAKRSQQCNRVRDAPQPFTSCGDPSLR